MAFADRSDGVATVLLVVIAVNHGDDLLGGEIPNVGIAGHVERAGLHGRHAVDGEVLLVVLQTSEVRCINDHAGRDIFTIGIIATYCTGHACCRVHSDALGILANLVGFTTVVVGAGACEGEG